MHARSSMVFLSFLSSLLSSSLSLFIANHRGIATNTGFSHIKEYRYFNPANRGLDIEGMVQDLKVTSSISFVPLFLSLSLSYCSLPRRDLL